MQKAIKILNRSIRQLVRDEGIIEALLRLNVNEKLSFIDERTTIGEGTVIYSFVNLYGPAKIGKNCVIGSHITIQGDDTVIGDNVRIGDFSFISAGTIIENNAFIGQHVSLTNDKYPKSGNKDWKREPVRIEEGSSLGSGTVILPGVTIGTGSVIGAGSVVTKSVPPHTTFVGNPARPIKRKKKG